MLSMPGVECQRILKRDVKTRVDVEVSWAGRGSHQEVEAEVLI